jgi:hypothetical protein
MFSTGFSTRKRSRSCKIISCLSLVLLVPLVITTACGAAPANNSSTLTRIRVLPLGITTQTLPSATAGTPYSASLAATGGVPPYAWQISSGVLPDGFALGSSTGIVSGTTTETGTFAFQASVMDADGAEAYASLSVLSTADVLEENHDNIYCPVSGSPTWETIDGPAATPTDCYNTLRSNTPAPNGTVSVSTAAHLTSALAAATCGQEITLQAGNVFSGNFTIPALSGCGANYLWIVTSGLSSLPAEGTRTSPCYSGVTSMTGRQTFNCPGTPGTYTAQIITPNRTAPLTFASGASNVRIIGIEITRATGTGTVYDLVATGNLGLTNIILDQVWAHGDESGGSNGDETDNLINGSGNNFVALVDSFTTDFYCISSIGACTDSHVFDGGLNNSSSTPDNVFKAVNNYLESAGECFLFGGGPAIGTPKNIEIRLNTCEKPLPWNPSDPSYNGGVNGHPLIVKNPGELKNASQLLYEGNQIQNTWAGFTQPGEGFAIGAKDQNGNCPLCSVHDITIRYGTLNTASYFGDFSFQDNGSGGMAASQYNISVHDIVADNLGYSTCYSCTANSGEIGVTESALYTTTAAAPYNNVSISHITAVDSSASSLRLGALILQGELASVAPWQMYDVTFTNSVIQTQHYGTYSAGGGSSSCSYTGFGNPSVMIPACWQTYALGGNCFIANGSIVWPGSNVTSVASQTAAYTGWNNGNGGNYTIASDSPCKGAATDGTDPGANIAAINSVLAGQPAPVPTTAHGLLHIAEPANSRRRCVFRERLAVWDEVTGWVVTLYCTAPQSGPPFPWPAGAAL